MIKLCAALLVVEGATLLAWLVYRDLRDDARLAAVVAPGAPVDVVQAFAGVMRKG